MLCAHQLPEQIISLHRGPWRANTSHFFALHPARSSLQRLLLMHRHIAAIRLLDAGIVQARIAIDVATTKATAIAEKVTIDLMVVSVVYAL